jgi:hypothetical protein
VCLDESDLVVDAVLYGFIVNRFYDGLIQGLNCKEGKMKTGGVVVELVRVSGDYVIVMPGGVRLYAIYGVKCF